MLIEKAELDLTMGSVHLKINRFTKDNGITIKRMVTDASFIQMVSIMLEILQMIEPTGRNILLQRWHLFEGII